MDAMIGNKTSYLHKHIAPRIDSRLRLAWIGLTIGCCGLLLHALELQGVGSGWIGSTGWNLHWSWDSGVGPIGAARDDQR